MDVVYICRDGENEELRYSLRSVAANLDHGRVWIFGGCPSWVRDAEHVDIPQAGKRFENTTANLEAACVHPDVSDPFILMNDDFYVMSRLAAVPTLHIGEITSVIAHYESDPRNHGSGYVRDMYATDAALKEAGYDRPLSFDVHTPLIVDKDAMLDAIAFCREHGLRGAYKRSVYGARAGLEGSKTRDVKVFNASCAIPPGPFLSSADAHFGRIEVLLASAFPHPCRYELPPRLTAVVTNHDYARYLPRCVESALEYCDEVLVYDDGSTDESMEVLASYGDRIRVTRRDEATGDPVWGSNLGISRATGSHLIFLDADNYLVSKPPLRAIDYCFAGIDVVNDEGCQVGTWRWPDWPLTAEECWSRFRDRVKADTKPLMPFPWGGVWRTSFLRGRSWRRFETTAYAADCRTALDWCKARPSLGYADTPFLAFRKHAGQWSGVSEQRTVMKRELAEIVRCEGGPEAADRRPRGDRRPMLVPEFTTKKEADVLYTSPARIIRRGRLVAFKGEIMPIAEAKRRGLIKSTPVEALEAVATPAEGPDLSELKMPELKELAKPLGITVKVGMKKADLVAAIIAAR